MTYDPPEITQAPATRRRKQISLFVGVLAGAVCIGAAILDPGAFWPAYLVAAVFVLGIGLGSLALALLHQLTGGRWGWAVLRELVACVQTLPISIILFLPLLMGANHIYPWLREEAGLQELPPSQQIYFESAFWLGRSAAYFAIWILLMFFVVRSYRATSRSNDPDRWHASARLSAWGLIVLWITGTFAAFDWMMALEPAWLSTIYGAIVMMGFAVSGLAFQLVIRPILLLVGPSNPTDPSTPDLATLLLAFLLVWVYLAFSQFFIIWHGDLPLEGAWYHRRSAGVWGILGTSLLLFHFVLPFILLLSRDLKRQPQAVAKVAAGLMLMRLLDLTWFILPAFEESDAAWLYLLPASALAAVGLCLAGFLNLRERLPALPSTAVIEPSPSTEARGVQL